jgi:sugar/nucleoside kinase (ribokinase family)
MPQNFDVTCVGNAKIDTFLALHEANDHLRFIKETNELCVKSGEKIIVEKAEILLGGDAANVSVGVSRLGLNVAIVAEIGKDEFAQKIINTLAQEKVDSSNILQTGGQQSSFSTIINYKGERTIFSEHVRRSHNFNLENISTKWVYLTSLGEEWENAYLKTADFVTRTQCFLAFNPGTLQIEKGKDNLKNILAITNLLFVNKEEAEDLLDIEHGQKNIEELLKDLRELGPKIAVITDGKNGSFTIDSKGNMFEKNITDGEVIERTGAGDAYSAGFLSALNFDKTINEAMVWGTKNAAAVISKVGAQAGLLYKADFG